MCSTRATLMDSPDLLCLPSYLFSFSLYILSSLFLALSLSLSIFSSSSVCCSFVCSSDSPKFFFFQSPMLAPEVSWHSPLTSSLYFSVTWFSTFFLFSSSFLPLSLLLFLSLSLLHPPLPSLYFLLVMDDEDLVSCCDTVWLNKHSVVKSVCAGSVSQVW